MPPKPTKPAKPRTRNVKNKDQSAPATPTGPESETLEEPRTDPVQTPAVTEQEPAAAEATAEWKMIFGGDHTDDWICISRTIS